MIAQVADFEETREMAARTSRSPAVQNPQNVKVERQDWVLFRTVEGLQQKAGVGKADLRRLVLKELADNGLDLGCTVQVGPLGDGYLVQDDGPGIDPDEVARLFSINRPMISSKLIRLPTRGALGNGLRVVAGAVLASDGSLVVTTRDRRLVLRPEMDGSTTLVESTDVNFPVGVRIEICFGHALPSDSSALSWAQQACRLAEHGDTYTGKSSPHWYDAAQFHELLYAYGSTPVRELISGLDGCSGAKAGRIVSFADLERVTCEKVSREQAVTLLTAARTARPVNPRRLGAIGPKAFPNHTYACEVGTVSLGSAEPLAEIPFAVEAWVISLLTGARRVSWPM
jgi:hypothetical protein